MKNFKCMFILSGILISSLLLTGGCGGGAGTVTAPMFTITPGSSNTPTPVVPSNTPSPTVSSTIPSPTVYSGEKGTLTGYILGKSDGNVNGLVMIVANTAPGIAGYLPVNSASVSLSNNPFVETKSDITGRFTLQNVPYSQPGNLTKVSVTGDTSNIQASAPFIPLEIDVIVNPSVSPGNVSSVGISPDGTTVYTNEIRQFIAYCINSSNELINPNTYTWSVEGGIGTIDNNGIFHASDNAGQGSIKVTAGSQSTTVSVKVEKLATSGTITGVVTYLDGNPATGMKVTVSGLSQFATVDSTGGYKIDKISAGEITVTVTDNGKVVWTGKSTVKSGEITTLDIHLDYSLWKVQNSGTSNSLSSVYFLDNNTGCAVGSSGTVVLTSNGGKIWSLQNAQGGFDFKDVHFVNSSKGWIAGNGDIFYTINRGVNWVTQHTGDGTNGLYFVDSNNGWAVGGFLDNGTVKGTILYTANSGTTWVSQISGTSYQLFDVHFVDVINGWAVGDHGTILHTTNGGITWDLQSSGITTELINLHFVDVNNGWVVGRYGIILHTANGGSVWTTQNSGTTNWLEGVHFVDSNKGWIAGAKGTILNTIDGGNTWTIENSGTDKGLLDIYFVNNSNGWAVGENGTILEY
ncbi:MAG: YCF48-related protein [Candidatus Eremiobacterota bacterium]